MLYLLYGLEKFLINDEISKIIKANNIDEYSISRFNAKTSNIDEILLDAISMPLFGEKRLIIVEDAYFFTSEKAEDDVISKLDNYLNDYNKQNITIFDTNNEKLDERKKITKLIKNAAKVLEFNTKKDSNTLIKELLSSYNIDYRNIVLIKEKLNDQADLIPSEINKLITYKEDKNISETDIENVISEYPNIDFFKFIDDIVNKNIKESIRTYEELLKLKEEPIKIIVTLANQFRLMYQAKIMNDNGYSEKDIATELGEHPYRVKLAIMKARNYSSTSILENLKKLGEINLNAKKGLVDSSVALELFILGL